MDKISHKHCDIPRKNIRSSKKRLLTKTMLMVKDVHNKYFTITSFQKRPKCIIDTNKKIQRDQKLEDNYLRFLSLLFSSLFILTCKILHHPHPLAQNATYGIVFTCGVCLVLFSFLMLKNDIKKGNISFMIFFASAWQKQNFILSLLGFLCLLFTICSLSSVRMICAMTVISLSPIIPVHLILRHRNIEISKIDIICYLLTFFGLGLFFIQGLSFQPIPDEQDDENAHSSFKDNMLGAVYVFLSTILHSIIRVRGKINVHEYQPYSTLFMMGLCGMISSPILMYLSHEEFILNETNLGFVFLCGISYFFGVYFNRSHTLINLASWNYLSIILIYIFSLVVIEETVTKNDAVASGIVILANYLALYKISDRGYDES